MAKQLNVDLRFNADTTKAKQSITELQAAIQKLGYGTAPKNGLVNAAEFEKASTAARELAYHLNNAYNAKTGNLDLSKLNASLKSSGTSLSQLTSNFKNAGATGQQAFISLANAIANADQPVFSLNSRLSTMFTTLKNVARFQISSSIMHGLIGGIQTAFNYAEDLNKSLNNIRIVTGQSTDQMARFAEQANKTARSLSASTLDYTNASLIYYQQGLDDQAVKARTDVTVKLANVSRQSAEEVSNQMTAIWNNFDDGAHSMEYFADVITALGATTASSSEEIATGLEKFAPIAGTIGLSYEKATSVLATIVANTRQSADTVGTGLRTIFSRFESLKLGETLEDGVDLNKYTKAMQTIGVNVLDANGKLRDMDSILDDVAANWEKLDNTQKTAFATTVGGVRQYTNLMAMFENWDDVQKNMMTASGAEGTLQNQAEIYAESWEAARKRVKTAAESIYSSLIDEDFFISVDNLIETILSGINKFIKNFGGIRSILEALFTFVLSNISTKIGPAIQKLSQDIQIMTGGSQKVYQSMQREFSLTTSKELASGNYSEAGEQQLRNATQLLSVKNKLSVVENTLSQSERNQAQVNIEGIRLQQQALTELMDKYEELKVAQQDHYTNALAAQSSKHIVSARNTEIDKAYETHGDSAYIDQKIASLSSATDQAEAHMFAAQEKLLAGFMEGAEKVQLTYQELFTMADGTQLFNFDSLYVQLEAMESTVKGMASQIALDFQDIIPEDIFSNLMSGDFDFSEIIEQLESLREIIPTDRLEDFNAQLELMKAAGDISTLQSQFKIWAQGLGDIAVESQEVRQALKNIDNATDFKTLFNGIKKLETAFKTGTISADEYGKVLKMLKLPEKEINALISGEKTLAQVTGQVTAAQDGLNNAVNRFNPTHAITGIEAISKVGATLGSVAMMMNSIRGAVRTLGDDSASVGEKITSTFMALSLSIPGAISMFKNFSSVAAGLTNTTIAQALAQKMFGASLVEAQGMASAAAAAEQALAAAKGKEAASSAAAAAAEKLLKIAKIEDMTLTGAYEGMTLSAAIAKKVSAGASLEEAVNSLILDGAITEETGAKILNTGATWAQVAANMGLKASMIELFVIIVAVVAIIAALVVGIKALMDAYNADAIAAEQAAAAADELKQAAADAKQEADDLRDSIDKYDSAIAKLKECTKGTKEWAEALEEVKEASKDVLEHIGNNLSAEDYEALRASYSKNNGVLDEDLLKKAQKNADQRAEMLAYSADVAAYNAQMANTRSQSTNLARRMAAYDSDVMQGNVSRESVAQSMKSKIEDNLSDLADSLDGRELREKLTALGIDVSNVSDTTMTTWLSSIQSMATQAEKAASKLAIIARIKLDDIYGDDYSDEAKDYAVAGQDDYIKNRQRQWKALMTNSGGMNFTLADGTTGHYEGISKASGNGNEVYQLVLEQLQQIEGWENVYAAASGNGVLGTDAHREFVFNVEGEDKKFSADYIANLLATQDALTEAGVDLQTFTDISSSLSTEGQDFLGAMALGFNDRTKKMDFTDFLSGYTKDELENIGSIYEKFGISADDLAIIAEQFGVTVEDIEAMFNEGVQNAIDGFDSIGDKLHGANIQDIFGTIKNSENFGKLDLNTQSQTADLFQDVFNALGQEGAQAFADSFSKLTPEQMEEVTKQLSNFDWVNGDINDLYAALARVGVTAEDINLQPFIDYMIEAGRVASTFTDAAKQFKGIEDIIGKLKTGDTIDPDKYQELIDKYGLDEDVLNQFFMPMADGTYRLIGAAEEFQAAIRDIQLQKFYDTIAGNNKNIDTTNRLYDYTGGFDEAGFAKISGANYTSGEGYDKTQVQNQLDFLSLLPGYEDLVTRVQTALNNGESISHEDLDALTTAVVANEDAWYGLEDQQKAWSESNLQCQMAIASSAQSLGELQALAETGLSQSALDAGLQSLATQYENCSEELAAFRQALESGDEAQIASARSALELSVRSGELAKGMSFSAEEVEDMAQQLKLLPQYEKASGKALAEMAKDQLRFNKAMSSASSNMDSWKKALKEIAKTGGVIDPSIMQGMADAYGDLLDIDGGQLSKQFLQDAHNLDLMQEALDGNVDSYNELQEAAQQDMNKTISVTMDPASYAAFLDQANAIESAIADLPEGIDLGDVEIGTQGALDAMTDLVNAAGMTAAQATAYLSSMGIDAEVVEVPDTTTDTKTYYGAIPTVTDEPWEAQLPMGGAIDGTISPSAGSVPRVEYHEQPLPVTETKSETGFALKVTSANKSSGGGGKVSRSGGGGKGGGGGGGGDKKITKKAAAKPDAGTRYHRVKAKQANNSNRQAQVAREKDRAFGAQKIKQGQKELDLQKEQIKLQKEYIEEVKKNLKIDKTDLQKAFQKAGLKGKDGKGLSLLIDKDGVIENFQDIEDALLAKENELINQYNNENWNGWQNLKNKFGDKYESRDEWFSEQKEKLDELRDAISQYEETQDLYEEGLADLKEQLDALADAALELLATKIQLNIDVDEDELALLEFMLKAIDDNAYKAAEAISLFGQETNNFLDQINTYQQGLDDLFRSKGLNPNNLDQYSTQELLAAGFTQNEIDKVREWRDAIISANESLLEMRANILDKVITTFQELNSEVTESYDLFDHYNDMLENYKNITDTMGKHINKDQRKLINDLNKAMLDNSKKQLETSKQLYDNMLQEQEKAKKAYDDAVAAGDEETARQWKEILDEVNEATKDAQETWMSQWEATTEMIQEIFETMLDQIVEDFNTAMGGAFGSLDYLSDAFDRRAETDEQYLQDYDKLYELNKLQRDLNKVLSDTRGVTNRKEMLELQKEITAAQEAGVKLSQYDLDVLRKKFELQNAYNDLQLARDAKSTVRLQRDREGNWGYVYTADEDKVAAAEQEYEDKLHEYQKLNDDYIKELQEQALTAQQTYRDTLREIMEDVTLTDEERQARIDELNNWYLAQQKFFEEQSNHVFENQAGTLERYLNTYATAIDDLIDTWEETSLADLTGLSTLDDYMNNWMTSSDAFLAGLRDALDDRKQQVEDILALTGTSIEGFGDQVSGAIDDIGKSSSNTQEEVLALTGILNEEFNSALEAAVAWEQEYADKIINATNANIAFAASLNEVIKKLSDLSTLETDEYMKKRQDYLDGKISEDDWFNWLHEYYRAEIGQQPASSFDTGGYTGIWGSEGRLAFLHEKEQIFNQADTANLLAAAKILRTIDLQVSRFSNGFGEQAVPSVESSGMLFEQSVHITAEFPNATNHAEIEEAFNNLANKATQYANRKNG